MRWLVVLLALLLGACTQVPLRGTGDLGLIIERADGRVALVNQTRREILARVDGLGDLSHASVVFSRDGRYAYIFGRDGGLSKVDLLTARLVRRVMQAGNSIGGAISQDGRLVVAQNYEPGGIKAFDAETLELVADVPASYGSEGKRSKVVGLADLPGKRFGYALFDSGEIRITDFSDPGHPRTESYAAGKQPYDGLVTPDGRYYIAGLFGEDGLAVLDTWRPEQGVRRILAGYGKGETPLPVFKMPHLRVWALAGGYAYLPAIGRHEVLVVDTRDWREVARIPVKGQPVFVMARPDGRQIWVNFAFPDNGHVQVIDTLSYQVMDTLQPGKAVLHMEFTPRGEAVWISARDDHKVMIYDTATRKVLGEIPAQSPSGIFFTSRAARMGF
ncbi:cytochrome D1 domain-containing protein [Denitratisoma oestradiolicum]|uniref:Protein NirF n=1 Tax=Denitratisoma oestradiolicum TaxID=311182 RepID=A0A6S6Y0U8_9PROT|nr:cytochrome D1 domain-containing protein [Denitratisoma oestradiolicum]TWO78810.1 protein nirF [Denitratisoma oestradiolicum]CAB1370105.1 Protein NirF [Denitratisoma oestradiolicum]